MHACMHAHKTHTHTLSHRHTHMQNTQTHTHTHMNGTISTYFTKLANSTTCNGMDLHILHFASTKDKFPCTQGLISILAGITIYR